MTGDDHRCFVPGCGRYGCFGQGDPRDIATMRWACGEHRKRLEDGNAASKPPQSLRDGSPVTGEHRDLFGRGG